LFPGSGKQLKLVNLFPDKDAVVKVLSLSMNETDIADFLSAVVSPRNVSTVPYILLSLFQEKFELFDIKASI
jgi:hypothetical protein